MANRKEKGAIVITQKKHNQKRETNMQGKEKKVVILGAGITGLAISYFLKQHGISSVIYEKLNEIGGLCRSFCINGYWFDYGGHCTFTNNFEIREILETNTLYNSFISRPYNYKNGKWIKFPVQNNLCVLDPDEKVEIIEDFINKPQYENPLNYEEWLRGAYGDSFAFNYPRLYTKKYWTVEPRQLETKWIGKRMYQPNLHEVLVGAFETETPDLHYSNTNGVRYPREGGFDNFLKNMKDSSCVLTGMEARRIDFNKKIVYFKNGEKCNYDCLILTIPLPELKGMFDNLEENVTSALNNLYHTSMVLVSLGVKKIEDIPSTSFYIYNEDILPSRVYSTSVMNGNGNNHVSLQAEVYFSKFKPQEKSLEEIKTETVKQLVEMGVIKYENIEVCDVRYEKYANVIFTPDIYDNRDKVHKMLDDREIYYAGRFADWDYLWTDQSMLSGKKIVQKMIERGLK